MQSSRARGNRPPAPLASQGFTSGSNRVIDKTVVRFGDLSDHATVRWVHIGEFPLPANVLSVDEIQDGFQ
jgi:hypothetical protein